MTGYESKKAAARDKLAQPAQAKLMQDAFDEWWDSNHHSLNEINPCIVDSFEYWAWEGWHAALAQPAQRPWGGLTLEEIALMHAEYPHPQGFAQAIEAKLKEKNCG